MYGPDVAFVEGTTTHRPAPHVPTFEAVPVPPPVLEHHLNVTICADFFYVQKLPFFHTISRDIGYRTVASVSDRHHDTILKQTTSVVRTYQTRGFHIHRLHGDHEFECVCDELLPIVVDVVPADSHVGKVERSIRTIKEKLRSCVHGLPFQRIPKLMVQHMVTHVVNCLNQFPWANGISSTMSPASLVTGVSPPDYNKMTLEFGTYVQLFETNDPTNTPKARSLGAIALTPTGNSNGDYYFLSLASGACISRRQWTILPIPDTAIARVEALASFENQPLIQDRGFVVEWRPDHLVDDDEYDRNFVLPNTLPPDEFDPTDFDPIDDDELNDLAVDNGLPLPPVGVAQGVDLHFDNENENNLFTNNDPNNDQNNYELIDETENENMNENMNEDNENNNEDHVMGDAQNAQENDEPLAVEEEGAHHHEEGGAQHDEEGGAHRHDVDFAPRYNLRERHVSVPVQQWPR